MSGSQAKRVRRAARFVRRDIEAQVMATFCRCPRWPGPHVETDRCRKNVSMWERLLGLVHG